MSLGKMMNLLVFAIFRSVLSSSWLERDDARSPPINVSLSFVKGVVVISSRSLPVATEGEGGSQFLCVLISGLSATIMSVARASE